MGALCQQEPIDIHEGLSDAKARKMAQNLEFKGAQLEEATNQIKRLYELFLKVDATQVEINPFGETPKGQGWQDGIHGIHTFIQFL